MKEKQYKIINIVFYKFYEGTEEKKQACVFYRDGSVKEVSYEDGITACEEIVKERQITSKNAFSEMINKEIIHVVSKKEFVNNFNNYVNKELIDSEIIEDAIDESLEKTEIDELDEEIKEEPKKAATSSQIIDLGEGLDDEDEEEEIKDEDSELVGKEEPKKTVKSFLANLHKTKMNDKNKDDDDDDFFDGDFDEDEDEEEIEDNKDSDTVTSDEDSNIDDSIDNDDDYYDDDFEDEFDDSFDDSFDESIEDKDVNTKKAKKESKVGGFFKKVWNKFKRSPLGVKLTAVGTAALLTLGLTSCGTSVKSKTGEMTQSNLTTISGNSVAGGKIKDNATIVRPTPAVADNNANVHTAATYEELLSATTNETQKKAMINVKTVLEAFNNVFAKAYVEEGKDIKACLTFDEVVALQQAYNDYSKNEIRDIFNGAEIRADQMTKDYKSASLQLMGAYAIENSENPVDMSRLLETDEAKEFYNKYHTMFLDAKKATGTDQLNKVKAFYTEVMKDFPITKDVRTEGIAHADAYNTIEAYKLSVTPMIAAAEMIFQNLAIDYTLNNSEIDFINDIGLCNYADDTFERVETITLSSADDKANPLYEQYRDAIIELMKVKDAYVIDDAHRELSKLDSFQRAVNGHFEVVEATGTKVTSKETTTTKTESRTETKTWEEKKTTTRTEQHKETKEITKEEKEKIDKEIEKKNKEAKEKAEKEAEEKRKQLQKEADEKKKEIEKEIEEEKKDLEDKIKEANDKIDKNNKDTDSTNNTKVNEKDFGDHNVKFDDNHSDKDGNLDDSVRDITTDKTGDKTNEPLPDPNKTGEEFDRRAPKYEAPKEEQKTIIVEEETEEDKEEQTDSKVTVEYRDNDTSIEYSGEVTFFDADGNPISNEDLVNVYIENMVDENDPALDDNLKFFK